MGRIVFDNGPQRAIHEIPDIICIGS
jgi:hypothetical protein